jgi:ketosteroid isomerase-like protein
MFPEAREIPKQVVRRRTIQNTGKERMKTRLIVPLVGLAISFAVPTFSQQKDASQSTIVQQRDLIGIPAALAVFGELNGKLDDAYNNKDAEAAAALFTEDAVLVTPDWMVFGRQAIKEAFQHWPITDFLSCGERLRLNGIDNAVWSVGEWSGNLQSQTGPVFDWGYCSTIYVREGAAWKIRMLTLTERPGLAATPSPTASPSQ